MTIATPRNTSHRSQGSATDWINGCSTALMSVPAASGSPTANTYDPITLWPSTEDRFFQTTVYVPFSRGGKPTEIAVGSDGSLAESSRSTRSAAEFRTVTTLNDSSIGSLNQMITRSGEFSSSLSGAGLELIWLAWAPAVSTVGPANTASVNATRNASNARRRKLRRLNVFSTFVYCGACLFPCPPSTRGIQGQR